MLKVNLENWLKEKGINTKVFILNCDPKNQNFGVSGSIEIDKLIKFNPCYWVNLAFNPDGNIIGLSHEELIKLGNEWYSLMHYPENDVIAVFGFNKSMEERHVKRRIN